jgi:hypothetical protein
MVKRRDDPHSQFLAWLLDGAEGEPRRDLAVHAVLCAECRRWVAAHDALSAIAPGHAPLPPSAAFVPSRGSWRRTGRVVATAGSVIVVGGAAALSVGLLLPGAFAGREQAQNVLGTEGSPEPPPHPPAVVTGSIASVPSPTVTATPSPTATPTLVPVAPTLRAVSTPTPHVTPPHSAAPTATPTSSPTATPVATASPTEVVTPSPSPTPTPTPSPTPSPS